jgi:cytochrome c oxidase subunit 2
MLKWLLSSAMANSGLVGLPIQGTEVAAKYDLLYAFLFWLSVFFFILVVGGMIYLAVKYRAGREGKTKYITDSHLLEATWTIIPTILLMVIFVWGYFVYVDMIHAPSNALEVRVIGKQWNWTYQYEDGRTTSNLFVPANRAVKLIMTSEDVLHSYFIPNFRVKQDVVPGMYTSVWFNTSIPGKHHVFCAEYCGADHSRMESKVVVLTEDQWKDFQRGREIDLKSLPVIGVGEDQLNLVAAAAQPGTTMAQKGQAIFERQCTACHTAGKNKLIGPGLAGLYGSKVELVDGSKVTADDNYIRESIENPNAKITKGFPPAMTPFKGLINDQDMGALIAYIRSLK